MKLICVLRAMLGLKPVHRWKRSHELVDTFEVKRCRRCDLVRKINKRAKVVQ